MFGLSIGQQGVLIKYKNILGDLYFFFDKGVKWYIKL